MQIGEEININNLEEEGIEDMFSKLLKEVVVYTNNKISEGNNNRKLNVNLEVTPMLKGAVSVYSVSLSCKKSKNESAKGKKNSRKGRKVRKIDAEVNPVDYSDTFKINKKLK